MESEQQRTGKQLQEGVETLDDGEGGLDLLNLTESFVYMPERADLIDVGGQVVLQTERLLEEIEAG